MSSPQQVLSSINGAEKNSIEIRNPINNAPNNTHNNTPNNANKESDCCILCICFYSTCLFCQSCILS